MTYNDIKFGLQNLRSVTAPAELHGCVSGFSCVRRSPADSAWIAHVIQKSEVNQTELDAVFFDLADTTFQQLEAGQFAFELILPDDDEPLDDRVRALRSWVVGFLSGLGAAGFKADKQLPQDVQEILVDLANLAQADVEAAQGTDADERDFLEIAEFVKVAVLLLFESLGVPDEPSPAEETIH